MDPVPTTVPALVTGASSGIGEHFAVALAERGHALTLVARRRDRLDSLARRLRREHQVKVAVLVADLETEAGREAVAARLEARGPWILVNNAGFGTRGAFVESMPGVSRQSWRSMSSPSTASCERSCRGMSPRAPAG